MSKGTIARMAGAGAGAVLAATAALALQVPGTPPAGKTPAPAAAAPAAGGDAARIAKGRELFGNWSCNSCHSLADAGATGHVGPSLDHNPNLTTAFVTDRVTNGQGAMPAFGGQMTDEEIATIAFYLTHVTAK